MKTLRVVGFLSVLLFASRANAQQYFGQNQVQYRHFDWRVLETEHFKIHYYPAEQGSVKDVARMAERAYARQSRILDHQFREKKPIILFASRADFGQNNVTGDLGEGTGGVTEGRFRLLAPLTGDYHSFEHVLAHEMVHEFQYDVFTRGKAENIQSLETIDPPLWFMEGMAEYVSGGPNHPLTSEWLRDAAVAGTVPSIEQMTERPDKYFPYRYGESLWEYVGERWGDAAIGQILSETATLGVARAIQKELGLSLHELSDEWREAVNATYLPQAAALDRPQSFARPLLTPRKSGGQIFLAPALSRDGNYIAFLSNGSTKRGEIFIDLWLGDARTGKRLKHLIKSTQNANFEELRLLYSQSAFSNNGKTLAFTAMREGIDVLYLLDLASGRVHPLPIPLDAVWSPTFSPDDRQIAFSGTKGGVTDLYIVDANGKNIRQLTNDKYGDLQPVWSPDGKTLAFATERSPATNLSNLKLGPWQIATIDIASGTTGVLPGQAGLNLNPQWSPDGRQIAFISDRTGLQNVFLYDFADNQHYQITNVLGGVSAITEFSPAISWARDADKMVFTYYERGDFTVWSFDHPASLKKYAFGKGPSTMVGYNLMHPVKSTLAATTGALDSLSAPKGNEPTSVYRGSSGSRLSSVISPSEGLQDSSFASLASIMADPNYGLPDTTRFKAQAYHARLHPDYIADPNVGYTTNYGTYSGGTAFVFSDLLGNHMLAVSAQIYGQLSDAAFFVGYANLSRRIQYGTSFSQEPYYVPVASSQGQSGGVFQSAQLDIRYVLRTANLSAQYPLNRFHRFETGLQLNNIDQDSIVISQSCSNYCSDPSVRSIGKGPSYNYATPSVAYVADNSLFGLTGPISGRRMRFQAGQALGKLKFANYLADYRRYDPIIFNTLTFATRLFTLQSVGRDEHFFQNYIGRPDYVRGYDRANFSYYECTSSFGASNTQCNNAQLAGSRVAVGNIELRFPVIRRFDLGPIGLPPVDGHLFYDAGLAWNRGQSISFNKPSNFDSSKDTQRYAFTSAGVGFRVNLFGIAILQWDYAHPYGVGRKPNWTFSLGAGY